jgi:hypothetical protein
MVRLRGRRGRVIDVILNLDELVRNQFTIFVEV